MHLNSELLFKKYAKPYFKKGMRVLEIGPSGIPSAYSKFVDDNSILWDTIDFKTTSFIEADTSLLTYIQTEEYTFPVEDNLYDIVLCGQVIEHVRELWTWLAELKRVCKPGGKLIIINPVSWPYHEAPIDCWRIYPEAMKVLCKYVDIKVDLCIWESLELELLVKYPETVVIPGESIYYKKSESSIKKILSWNKFVSKFGFLKNYNIPVEVSYDTITICTK